MSVHVRPCQHETRYKKKMVRCRSEDDGQKRKTENKQTKKQASKQTQEHNYNAQTIHSRHTHRTLLKSPKILTPHDTPQNTRYPSVYLWKVNITSTSHTLKDGISKWQTSSNTHANLFHSENVETQQAVQLCWVISTLTSLGQRSQ